MEKYKRLFDLANYIDDAGVCFSINGDIEDKDYYIPETICSRIICLATAYQLHYIPMIEIYGEIKLNKQQVLSLIEEFLFVQFVVNDEIIEYFVSPLTELLKKITQTSNKDDYLLISGN